MQTTVFLSNFYRPWFNCKLNSNQHLCCCIFKWTWCGLRPTTDTVTHDLP